MQWLLLYGSAVNADPEQFAPATDSDNATVVRLELPLDLQAPALARRTVAAMLQVWLPLEEQFVHDAVLLTSELVSNAVRHGGERVWLELALEATTLVIRVGDGSSTLPEQRTGSDLDESGRGLAIVEAIAEATGVSEDGEGGKQVWARVPLPDETA
jgi:anti-sigma regulatory factor (Ser/Thr protein kinase)